MSLNTLMVQIWKFEAIEANQGPKILICCSKYVTDIYRVNSSTDT